MGLSLSPCDTLLATATDSSYDLTSRALQSLLPS